MTRAATFEILAPDLGDSSPSMILGRWLVGDGQRVELGQVVCEVETDKVIMELESTSKGWIRILAAAGAHVDVGAPVATIVTRSAEDELNELIGLSSVKAELRKLAAFASVQERRRQQGKRTAPTSLHLVFTGNPGTGKTTVARLVGKLYADMGLLRSGHVVEADRADLVAEYVGQTDAKTKAKIAEAQGGVLFIDEAYTLAPPHSQLEFGLEAINALLVEMENKRDRLAVIVAGYSKEMERFIKSNPGLKSRFTRYINFDDYSAQEMLEIFQQLAERQDYVVAPDAIDELLGRFAEACKSRGQGFGNGRYVRTVFEKVIELHSLRCAQDAAADISMLGREDIPIDL